MGMNFKDKVVVVTGAGSGIGKATLEAFAREGARVHAVDVQGERAAGVAEALRAEGFAAVSHTVDMTSAQAVLELAERIFASEGRVDILHNNAGVGHGAPVTRTSLADWKWVMDTNLWTVIHGIHAFVPRMCEQTGGGHIVNTASAAGLFGIPGMAPYCTSKFAVVGLSEALAAELHPFGVRVTVICPGLVKTRIVQDGRIDVGSEQGPQRVQQVYDRFGVLPEHVARDVLSAVRDGRSLQLSPQNTKIPWMLKRMSSALYQHVARRAAHHLNRRFAG
jgi:NAD(P)-dependent dehydrogenase (short-subunit alcohol dehydrogenase family)